MLNLPDDLKPSEIKGRVLDYGRKHDIPNLWWNVKLDMRAFADGYAVLDYTKYKEDRIGGGQSFQTREAAEIALEELSLSYDEGGILIHVVEDDWESYREGDMDVEFLSGQLADFSNRINMLEMTVFVLSLVLKQHNIDVLASMKELREIYVEMPDERGMGTARVLGQIVERFEGSKP